MRNFSGLDLAFCKSNKLRGLPCCRQEIPNGFGEGEGTEVCQVTFSGAWLDFRCLSPVSCLFPFANVLCLGQTSGEP